MNTGEIYKIILNKSLPDVLELQFDFPEIGYEWFRGLSQRGIAREYGVAERFGVSENVAAMIVRWAIRGIDEEDDFKKVKGLVFRDFYNLIAGHRRKSSIVKSNRRNGHRGFGDLEEEAAGAVSLAGVLASGKVPVSVGEKVDAYSLSLMDRFRDNKRQVLWGEISEITNRRYSVERSGKNVRDMVYRYKAKNKLN